MKEAIIYAESTVWWIFAPCLSHTPDIGPNQWQVVFVGTLYDAHEARRNAFRRFAACDTRYLAKMLANTLRTLEEDGYVSRKVYAEVPPRVEYSLTERAFSLMPHIDALIKWSEENMKAILDDRRKQPAGDV